MGEAVAIVSVAASAVVGVGGLAAAALGASRQRVWRSREERAIELRAVLEGAAERLSDLRFAIGKAHFQVKTTGAIDAALEEGFVPAQERLVMALSRIGVRRGSSSADYTRCDEAAEALSKLLTILYETRDEGLDRERAKAYSAAWEAAEVAEKAFLDAAARTLAWRSPKRTRARGSHDGSQTNPQQPHERAPTARGGP